MKNLIRFFALILITTGLQNCNMDPVYYSEEVPEFFYDSQDAVKTRYAMPIAYWATGNGGVPYTRYGYLSLVSTDETVMPNRNGDWYDGGVFMYHWDHSFPVPNDGFYETLWQGVASGIAYVASTLADFEQYVDFDALGFAPGTKETWLNQLNVYLAYFYLIGLDGFGGLPLYKEIPIPEELPRSTDVETFEYIEQLLKEALPNLPKRVKGGFSDGSITQGVAASLLVKLYFNAKPYTSGVINKDTECAQLCQDILDGKYGYYALATDWRDIFGWDNEVCDEIIWAVPSEPGIADMEGGNAKYACHYNTKVYLGNANFNAWNGWCITPSQDIEGVHYGKGNGNLEKEFGVTFRLGCPYDKFEDNDVRKENYLYYGTNADYVKKYGNKKYKGMFLAGKLVNPLTGKAQTADGSREYAAKDTIPFIDQVAQLCPRKVYEPKRMEGAMYAEENSGIRLMKMSPIPTYADNALRFQPDIPVIRLTEIQYTLAELKYNAGDKAGAAKLINAVRSRYFEKTTPSQGPDPNPVTAANLDKYRLADEWMIEFIGESRRRTDLVRWNMYTQEPWWDHRADGPGQEYKNRLPLSLTVLMGNPKLEQNPGYSGR